MKLLLLSMLIFTAPFVKAQVDTLAFFNTSDSIIRLIEDRKIEVLLSNSTDSIKCFLCDNRHIPALHFFKHELDNIFNDALIKKLKHSAKLLYVDRQDDTNLAIVFYHIYAPNELASGHEGGQFGIWLYRDKGALKFMGIETVP